MHLDRDRNTSRDVCVSTLLIDMEPRYLSFCSLGKVIRRVSEMVNYNSEFSGWLFKVKQINFCYKLLNTTRRAVGVQLLGERLVEKILEALPTWAKLAAEALLGGRSVKQVLTTNIRNHMMMVRIQS